MNQISIIIQARTGSTRLPNKIIKPFYKDKTLLDIIIYRLKEIDIPIIIATTENEKDDEVEEIGLNNKVNVFRGVK